MNVIFLFLKGMAVGGANVMPGVSGATLAVIFHMYDKLIQSVNNLFSNVKESLKFLLPVGAGMIFGIFTAAIVLNLVLERFSLQAGGFIAGLMAGSIPFIYSQCVLKIGEREGEEKSSGKGQKVPIKYFAIAVIAALVVIALTLLVQRPEAVNNGIEVIAEAESVNINVWFFVHLFIGGAFAAAAMVVPGISGAMVLMLFGLYHMVVVDTLPMIRGLLSPEESVSRLEILSEILIVIVPLGLGIIAGILLGAKLIAKLLEKFHSATYFAIIGLVFGTIFAVFYNPETYQSHEYITPWLIVFTVIAFVCGAAVSLLLGKRKA